MSMPPLAKWRYDWGPSPEPLKRGFIRTFDREGLAH